MQTFGANMKIWRGQFLAAVAVSLFLTGCNKPADQSGGDTIKVGEYASLTARAGPVKRAPICKQNKLPIIPPASTNPKVTKAGDYFFGVFFIYPLQGRV